MRVKHECFNCPDRTATCKKTCEKWKAYEALRNEDYEKRLDAYKKTQTYAYTFEKRLKKLRGEK